MAPSFLPTSGGLKRRRVVVQPKLAAKRANDGFWTPGMGEAGFDETAPVTLDSATPTANENDPAKVFATLTAKVLAPTHIQLADSSSTLDLPSPTSLDSVADLPLPSSSDVVSERIFNIPSASAAPGKVLRPSVPTDEFTATADSPTALETVESADAASVAATETERLFAPASSSIVVKALQPSTSSDEGVPTASATFEAAPSAATSDKIFNPKWSSAIYAVAASSSEENASATLDPILSSATAAAGTAIFRSGSSRIAALSPTSSSPGDETGSPTSPSSSIRQSSIVIGSPSASSATSLALAASSAASLPSVSSSPSQTASDSPALSSSSLSSSHSSSQPSSSSSSATSTPRTSDATASFFSRLGKTPANIALTTIVSLAVLAILLGLLAFFFRRCHRRKKRSQLGDVLNSDGNSPPDFGEPWERFENVHDGSPMMVQRRAFDVDSPGIEEEEVWQRRMTQRESGGPFVGLISRPATSSDSNRDSGMATNGDWESLQRIHREEGEYRRGSESTIGTGILYPSQAAYPSYGAFHLPNRMGASSPTRPPPAVLVDTSAAANAAESVRPPTNPHDSTDSASVYSAVPPATPIGSGSIDQVPFMPYRMERAPQQSRPSAIPLSPVVGASSPTSPTSPTSPSAADYQRREVLSQPTAFAPGIIRTLPSISGPSALPRSPPSPSNASPPSTWKESLERVMGNAADLITSSSAPTPSTGDSFTDFPTPAPRRPLLGRTSSGIRPTRPPPLTLGGTTPLSPVAPSPRVPSPPSVLPSTFLLQGDSNRSSSGSSSSLDGPLVSPTTLAFPERALILAEQVTATQGVQTPTTVAIAERRGSKQDSAASSPDISLKGVPRSVGGAAGGALKFEPIPFSQHRTPLPAALSPGDVEVLADAPSASQSAAVNPFVPARPPRRAISIPTVSSTPTSPLRRTRTHNRARSLLSASAISTVMGRQRSASLGSATEEDHGVSSFSDDDSQDGDDSSSLSHVSISSVSEDEGVPGGRLQRPTSVHDRFVGSLMIERRRRSLASLSGMSNAGTGSRPNSVRVASRQGSVGPASGNVRERLSLVEVR